LHLPFQGHPDSNSGHVDIFLRMISKKRKDPAAAIPLVQCRTLQKCTGRNSASTRKLSKAEISFDVFGGERKTIRSMAVRKCIRWKVP
jgi:hypothetical protein